MCFKPYMLKKQKKKLQQLKNLKNIKADEVKIYL